MIFVTVGTTMPFDELFEEIDRLAEENYFDQEIVCQTGQSNYIPSNCKYFKFESDLSHYFQEADFLIVHGGTGSTIEAILSGKPFIAFANPRGADDHQAQFLSRMSKEYSVIWSRNCKDLTKLYELAISQINNGHKERNHSLSQAILDLCQKKLSILISLGLLFS